MRALWRKFVAIFRRSKPDSSGRTDTEFSAEVVRITQLEPHGNADRLEIARFEMAGSGVAAYEVAVQKDTYKVGDLAGYFSVDCIVPTDHPAFHFLTTRIDGAGKTHYRLRAARLRGRYSQGLLVPVSGRKRFGDQLAEEYRVTYHRAPEPGEPTQPSQRKPRAQPIPIYGVDSLKKCPGLFEGAESGVCITEKIHGTNVRFGWVRRKWLGIPVGWRFVVGSHRVIKDGTGGSWYGGDLYSEFAKREHLAERTKHLPGVVFYGELYGYTYDGKRIQDLVYGRRADQGPGFVLFDVLVSGNRWLAPGSRWALADALRFEHVPVIGTWPGAPSMDTVASLAEGASLVAPSQIREGVVVETLEAVPPGQRRKAKYVSQAYLLRKTED